MYASKINFSAFIKISLDLWVKIYQNQMIISSTRNKCITQIRQCFNCSLHVFDDLLLVLKYK